LDAASGEVLGQLGAHTSQIMAVTVSHDGRWALTSDGGGGEARVILWDLQTAKLVHELKGHSEWVTGLAITKDNRVAVSASRDHTLRLWDTATGRQLAWVGLDTEPHRCMFTPDDKRLVVADEAGPSGQIHIFDLRGF
jgi:WD40 repeat protein